MTQVSGIKVVPTQFFYSAYAKFRLGPSTQILTFFKFFLYHSIENQILYRMVQVLQAQLDFYPRLRKLSTGTTYAKKFQTGQYIFFTDSNKPQNISLGGLQLSQSVADLFRTKRKMTLVIIHFSWKLLNQNYQELNKIQK